MLTDCDRIAKVCDALEREREREGERGVPANTDLADKIEQIHHTDRSDFPPKYVDTTHPHQARHQT